MTQPTPLSAQDLSALLDRATNLGLLSPNTQSQLSGHLGSLVIAGASGTPVQNILSSDVTLVTLVIDASSSICAYGMEAAVRAGQNLMLDAFAGSKEADSILVALWTFNSSVKVVHSYVPVKDATRLDKQNYKGTGCTVLYDAWLDALTANVAYAQTLRDGGTPTRSVVVAISDGEDTSSVRRVNECKKLSSDLLASEQFVLAFVGVGDQADFRSVARGMGVPDGNVAVEKSTTPSALRQLFQLVSRSAIRASQGRVRPGAQAGFFQP